MQIRYSLINLVLFNLNIISPATAHVFQYLSQMRHIFLHRVINAFWHLLSCNASAVMLCETLCLDYTTYNIRIANVLLAHCSLHSMSSPNTHLCLYGETNKKYLWEVRCFSRIPDYLWILEIDIYSQGLTFFRFTHKKVSVVFKFNKLIL